MFQAFVVTLREGIEAFLIVAISLSYLKKTGRRDLASPVYWGIAVSLVSSAIAGYFFSLASNQSLWEGFLAIVAAVLVATLVVHMMRVAHTLKGRIQARLSSAAAAPSTRTARLGIFCFIVLMVTREGMETALLLGTLLFQMKAVQIFAGAVSGLLAAAFVAFLWSRYGHRVDLRRFMQVTAVFLLVFVVQLLIYGVHELAEGNFFPHSLAIHDATEPYGPDGIYGKWLSFGLVAIPLAWLFLSYLADRVARVKRGHELQEKFATK
ncbi:MAG TPA: FTR1 family protein [Acidobacteriota bacterium]|nr:FTR1 family protein [Acidobacteriota bacterium]